MSALTLVSFVLATAVVVYLYARRAAHSSVCGGRCPSCEAPLAASARECPRCGTPMQVFEVAAAPVVRPEADSRGQGDGDALHAVVRADVCVGCAACVPPCPVDGAIRMEGKLAVVTRDRCGGCGVCADACPVGGIVLTTGAAVHQVEVPDVRPDFQTNLPGVYIVGELGGRGLIKNAINEGKVAARSVARDLRAEAHTSTGPRPVHDLVVVGSGPGGLSAALEARALGLDCVVVDQGTMADSIRKYPRHKLLLAEPVKTPLFGDLWVADASKETLLQVWETIVREAELDIRTGHRVHDVRAAGNALCVSGTGFADIHARRVILAMGRRGTPRKLGVPGEESERVFYDIVEMEAFRGRHVLVVGGGDSALESAVGLSHQEGTVVTLSYRRDTFDRAKSRNVEKLEAAEAEGRLRVLRRSTVERIDDTTATVNTTSGPENIRCDNVIVRVGGVPPTAFLERIGIGTVKKELPLEEAREAVHA